MGRPPPVVVGLVVSTVAEAVGDARLLALPGVVVALVSAGGAMGGGVSDGPGGCAGSDADGAGAVTAVKWTVAVGVFLGVADTDGGPAKVVLPGVGAGAGNRSW